MGAARCAAVDDDGRMDLHAAAVADGGQTIGADLRLCLAHGMRRLEDGAEDDLVPALEPVVG